MKKKKGFTLIELLAVIVILAIIALIATPIVLNLIEKARLGAAKDSAYGVKKATQLYYQSLLLNETGLSSNVTISFNDGVITSSVNNSDVEYKLDGTIPKSGSITITNDGEISGTVIINGYTCPITNSGTINCTKGEELTPVTYRKYNNGEIVYYNPTTNKFCSNYNIDNSITEYKGDTNSKTTDNQTGCLKWYAYLDSEESETVNLLLDHNTTAHSAWGNTKEEGPTIAINNLSNDIYSWNNEIKTKVRLITADEIAKIVGIYDDTQWNSSTSTDWFYLDGANAVNWQTKTAEDQGESDYAWLFNYTYGCTIGGCVVSDNSNYGYWTSSAVVGTEEKAWRIDRNGNLHNNQLITNDSAFGIRPVVTVNKNVGHDGTSRVYYNGEIVYFNPVTNTQCYNYVEDNSTTGYKGENDPNKTESQNGCMRWFAYLDNGSATDLKLLADHNTTARITWYDTSEYKILSESNLQSELDDLVDDNEYDWNVPTTIISATDIALITDYAGTNGVDWDSSSINSRYYFENNLNSEPGSYSQKYWWLYDRTYNCEQYGCKVKDNNGYVNVKNINSTGNIWGFWTQNNLSLESKVWYVYCYGMLDRIAVDNIDRGLRPVITVSKSLLD